MTVRSAMGWMMGVAATLATVAHAEMFAYKPGVRVVLEEDFNDNAAGWALGVGSAISNSGPGGQGEWGSTNINGTALSAALTLAPSPNYAAFPVSVYYRIRTSNTTGGYGGSSTVQLSDDGTAAHSGAQTRPSQASFCVGRSVSAHSTAGTPVAMAPATSETFADTSTYVDFRADFTAYPNTNTAIGSVKVDLYRYVGGAWTFRGSVGGPSSDWFWLGNALAKTLTISTRNSGGAVYYEALALTQNTPPRGIAVLLR